MIIMNNMIQDFAFNRRSPLNFNYCPPSKQAIGTEFGITDDEITILRGSCLSRPHLVPEPPPGTSNLWKGTDVSK